MEATIGGARVDLTEGKVVQALMGVEPEAIRDHFVVVAFRRYPVKQALEAATGIDRSDFTSHQARALFRRLGFELGRAEGRVGESAPPYGSPPEPNSPANANDDDPFTWLTEADLRRYDGKWIAVKNRSVIASAQTPDEVVQFLRKRGLRSELILKIGATGSSEIPGVGF